MEQAGNIYEILLVEDNPGDVRLTQEIFKNSELVKHIHVVYDGEEALNYLRGKAPYASHKEPHLILLDLNLPRKDGLELLSIIKNDPDLKHIPVIVLTSSDSGTDINKAYQLFANAYITKPVDFEQYSYIVKYIEKFWFTLAKLPHSK